MRKKTGATEVVRRRTRYKDHGSTGLDAEGTYTADIKGAQLCEARLT